MNDDLRELYQEVILDHGRNPRNFRHPEDATCAAHGDNPLCGDQLTVYVTVDENGIVSDAAFEGRGCAISVASASLMTELIRGKSEADVRRLFESFHLLATGDEGELPADMSDELERLNVLSGVREFPMRVKCATLAWHTMKAAMEGNAEVSTEDEV